MYYLNTKTPYILFQEALNSEIYVDKSMLIDMLSAKIKTSNKYISLLVPEDLGNQ